MNTYRISYQECGSVIGIYNAQDQKEALDVMARKVGYNCYLDICRVIGKTYNHAKAELKIELLPG